MTSPARRAQIAYVLALAVVVIDQIVKSWVVTRLAPGLGITVPVWGPLRLTLVENSGISYGFFQSGSAWSRWALAAFSLGVTVGLAIWAQSADKVVIAAAIGLIMGGALGNMIDRVARGSVVDFIDVQALHFPWVFNVADSAITVGIIVLLADGLFAPKARQA
jgi:signal peptidase II